LQGQEKPTNKGATNIFPLWVLVFFAGWFIMQTELVGARALTPYFGNSIFVWGSVIAVFLLALAVGYGLGGRLTRRYPSHWTPAALLVGAGVLVGASVLFQDALCNLLASSAMDVRWGALFASLILYGPPMVLAGTVSPYAVHLATASRQEVGARAGMLYSISTVGSFIGSLATSFVLVPAYSLTLVACGGGAVATVIALVTAAAQSMRPVLANVVSLGTAAVAIAGMTITPSHIKQSEQLVYAATMIGERLSDAPPSTLAQRLADAQREALTELKRNGGKTGEQVLLSLETAYHRVEVTQNGPIRMLTFGKSGFRLPQTLINLKNIKAHISEYTGIMMAPALYKQDVKRVLLIGLGGGDVARAVELCYPNVVLDAVEIDPAVVRIARDYFFWRPGRNVTIYTMDGRTFVNLRVASGAKPYDWIIIDAFDNDFIPFHMTTLQFYQVIARALAPDGAVSINTRIDHELYSYQARTLEAAFGCVDAYMAHRSGNIILVAQNGRKTHMTTDEAFAAMKRAGSSLNSKADLAYVTSCILSKPNWVRKGEVLTDMWAPVEGMLKAR